jgi:hypothetical protein
MEVIGKMMKWRSLSLIFLPVGGNNMIYSRIFIFLLVGGNSPREFCAWLVGGNSPREFRAWMHSPAVNHPGAENGMNKTAYKTEGGSA